MGKRNFDAESREYRILNANSYNTFNHVLRGTLPRVTR